ncbi:MAG: carbohydrate-binding domain-containing protein [Bacteroidales bacterium]|nr:carbohydrate-binding domain-containing protein [Bacteroidales bacterium]
MKNHLFLVTFLSLILCFYSCDPENVIDNQTTTDADTLDYVWDATKVVKISLNNSSIITDSKNVTVAGSVLNINAKGTYEITGTLADGQIIVNTSGIVRLILNNVNVSNSTSSPLFVADAKKTILILPEGTNNTFTDAANYTITKDSLNSAIYSKDYLAVFGQGKLTVNGNYNGGIASRDELVIESGSLDINAVGFGIKGKDYLKIQDGNIKVISGGDGLKSDKDSTLNDGFIEINGGTFQIVSANDAISAQSILTINKGIFELISGGGSTFTPGSGSSKGLKSQNKIYISGGTFYINSADNCIDADNDIEINDGNFTLLSGNKPIDSDSTLIVNNGDLNITKAIKGISSHNITINAGKISIDSRNDCLKATLGADLTTDDGSSININGGTILLTTEKGDALDSNGSISMTAGLLVVQGSSTQSDDAVTYRSTCLVSGGIIAASGATSLAPGDASSQNSVLIRFNSILNPGTIVNIQDASGNKVLTFRTTKNAYCIMASLPAFSMGATYNVYTGGSATGTDINGYYPEVVYTAGSKRGLFTIYEKVTKVTF